MRTEAETVYAALTAAVVGGLLLAAGASYYGWGLESDASALAESRSVRQSSLHIRRVRSGWSFGK
ncbi:MAG: hypothetical protein HY059_10015 [Proteobacteria bacterium]|nr:hypothetical protein [Pseudomonadota bacterium]